MLSQLLDPVRSCSTLWALGVVWLLSYNSSILFDAVVCNSSQARPKMTMKMRTTIEILTPHAQHYGNFLQNFWAYCSRHGRVCGKVSFYGEHFFTWLYRAGYGGPFWREQPWSVVNFHFCPVDEAVIAPSWCGLSVSLLSTGQKWKLRSLDRGFGDFRGFTKRP